MPAFAGGRRALLESSRPLDAIAALFAGGSPGLDFNFTKLDRLFQMRDGTVPVTAPEDVIGLALDSSKWAGKTLPQVVASQPELLTNFNFVGGLTGWFIGNPTVTWQSDGNVLLDRVGQNAVVRQTVPVVQGKVYRLAASALRTAGTGNMVALVRDTSNTALSSVLNYNASSAEQVTYWTATLTGDVRICLERTTTDGQGLAYYASFKEIPAATAEQQTTGFKPKYQVDGAKFDASDDRLTTLYSPQATDTGPNCMIAQVTVPAVIPSSQMIAGAFGGTSDRFFLSVGADGVLRLGTGALNTPTPSGDLRGQSVTLGLSYDAATVRGFVNDTEVYTGARSGSVNTAVPVSIGAYNNANTSHAGFWGGNVKRLIVAQKSLDLATFKAIRSQILSGG